MKPVIVEVIKSALKFFSAGAVIALGAPYFGSVAGLAPGVEAASSELGKFGDPVILGAYFAAVGALDAVLKPVFARLFAEKPPPPSDKV